MNENIQSPIKEILESIKKKLSKNFKDNLKSLILYGSWVKGTANGDSDIDLIAILRRMNKKTRKRIHDIKSEIDINRSISIVPVSLNDFKSEKLPLYTAVKKEGRVIYGEIDLSINPVPEKVKYADFFKRSNKFESDKIKIAEELLDKNLTSGIAEICFIASKHAIQATLAMEGKGYTSKISLLLPLARKNLGKEIPSNFQKLVGLYVKSEYEMEFLSDKEAKLAIKYAKKIMDVYNRY
jgi:predicted nucleotidyltransferase